MDKISLFFKIVVRTREIYSLAKPVTAQQSVVHPGHRVRQRP